MSAPNENKYFIIDCYNGSHSITSFVSSEISAAVPGVKQTLFLRSTGNRASGLKSVFSALKNTSANTVVSIRTNGKRYFVEHLDVQLHLNVGNQYSIRDVHKIILEWEIIIVAIA